jgi:hypothetical protein
MKALADAAAARKEAEYDVLIAERERTKVNSWKPKKNGIESQQGRNTREI